MSKEKQNKSKFYILQKLIEEKNLKGQLQEIDSSAEREKFLIEQFGHKITTKTLEEKYPKYLHEFKLKNSKTYKAFHNLKAFSVNNKKQLLRGLGILLVIIMISLWIRSCNRQAPNDSIARVIAVDGDKEISLYELKDGTHTEVENTVKYGEKVRIKDESDDTFTEIEHSNWLIFSKSNYIKTNQLVKECDYCLLKSFAGDSFGPEIQPLLNTDSWVQKALIEYFSENKMIGPYSSILLSNCIRNGKLIVDENQNEWMIDTDFRTEHKKAVSLKWGRFFDRGYYLLNSATRANYTAVILKSAQTDYRLLLFLEVKNAENGDPIADVKKEYILPDSLYRGYYLNRTEDEKKVSDGIHILTLYNPFSPNKKELHYGYSEMHNCLGLVDLLEVIERERISSPNAMKKRKYFPDLEDFNRWAIIEKKLHFEYNPDELEKSSKSNTIPLPDQGPVVFYNDANTLYIGERKGKYKHGYGLSLSRDGFVYDGRWKNNLKNGYGESFHISKKVNYQGYWNNDLKHGDGTYTTNENKVQRGKFFEGTFDN